MRLAVGIATAGRRDVLTETISFLNNQTRAPDELLICPSKPEDVNREILRMHFPSIDFISADIGSSTQRNALIANTEADLMVFFDDDFLPAADFLFEVEKLFSALPEIVVATGEVIADGISGAGLDFEEGCQRLSRIGANDHDSLEDVFNGYGCNMIVRMEAVRRHVVRFDEALPLYAWLEDLDFSRQLAPFGRIVRSSRLRGVHLGTKRSGRSPGKRLGYSQVANPIYLARKGTMPWPRALRQMRRNFVSNLVRSLKPEPWVDRKGRLAGNLMALRELVVGRLHPTRILEMT